MELVYIEIVLDDGSMSAWSSSGGKLECEELHWRDVFESVKPSGVFDSSRVMIRFLGNDSVVTDEARLKLMESAKAAGFGVVRMETGEKMEPAEAFELMELPFT